MNIDDGYLTFKYKKRLRIKKRFFLFTLLIGYLLITLPISADENELILMEKARITQYIEETKNMIGSHADTVNASVIKQIGNDNNASIVQSQSASYQAGNFAFVYQHGNQNNGAISQHGGNHSAVIWQKGNNHNAAINQQSSSVALSADIRQFGALSDISISQSGSGQQSISIEQHAYSGSAPPVIVETH